MWISNWSRETASAKLMWNKGQLRGLVRVERAVGESRRRQGQGVCRV